MEFFGETGRGTETIGSHVHYYQAGWEKVSLGDYFPAARQSLGKGRSWWDEFHVFSVEWTPTEYVFRIDGREYYRETGAVSQAQQYLVLSNLTSDYELDELTADELGDTAQVDWVRTYDGTSRVSSRATVGRKFS
jgi:beta-glucanase (GH16 family)